MTAEPPFNDQISVLPVGTVHGNYTVVRVGKHKSGQTKYWAKCNVCGHTITCTVNRMKGRCHEHE